MQAEVLEEERRNGLEDSVVGVVITPTHRFLFYGNSFRELFVGIIRTIIVHKALVCCLLIGYALQGQVLLKLVYVVALGCLQMTHVTHVTNTNNKKHHGSLRLTLLGRP